MAECPYNIFIIESSDKAGVQNMEGLAQLLCCEHMKICTFSRSSGDGVAIDPLTTTHQALPGLRLQSAYCTTEGYSMHLICYCVLYIVFDVCWQNCGIQEKREPSPFPASTPLRPTACSRGQGM